MSSSVREAAGMDHSVSGQASGINSNRYQVIDKKWPIIRSRGTKKIKNKQLWKFQNDNIVARTYVSRLTHKLRLWGKNGPIPAG
jgi:hypothetical protein